VGLTPFPRGFAFGTELILRVNGSRLVVVSDLGIGLSETGLVLGRAGDGDRRLVMG
jgi:hypothetical protein